jgi:hypothetical protein
VLVAVLEEEAVATGLGASVGGGDAAVVLLADSSADADDVAAADVDSRVLPVSFSWSITTKSTPCCLYRCLSA